jgi:hypothetical protein
MSETLEKSPFLLRAIRWLASGRRYHLIPNFDKSPYLLRLKVRGYIPPPKGEAPDPKRYRLNVYLHRFLSKDQDRDLHNHPWKWSFSIVLWGGYTEEKRNRRTGEVRRRRVWPGMINVLGARDFHRVLELHGRETWTLFFAGGKAAAWGFLVGGHFIRAREYLAAKGYVDEGGGGPSPLPSWLLRCACCGESFPPPGNYYTRVPAMVGRRMGVRAPVCDACAGRPLPAPSPEEVTHA